jgi:hypothetical protein
MTPYEQGIVGLDRRSFERVVRTLPKAECGRLRLLRRRARMRAWRREHAESERARLRALYAEKRKGR